MVKIIKNYNEYLLWIKGLVNDNSSLVKNSYPNEAVGEYIIILDTSYGSERDIYKDLGGYTVIIHGDDIVVEKEYSEILEQKNLKQEEFEYEDKYECPNCNSVYTVRVFLCSSDYAIVIVIISEKEKR